MPPKIILPKTRPEAFEHDLSPSQLSALRSACTKLGFAKSADWARENLKLETSDGALHRWYHKDDGISVLGAIASGAAMNAQIDEAEKKNPVSNFSQIARLLRILIAKFSVEGVSDPAKLELANALCRTALDYFKEEGREKERLADQQRFYEANKSAREKALELCLEEAKPYPEVTEQFKAAFAALKKARAGK